MSMNRHEIKAAIRQANEFISAAEDALEELDADYSQRVLPGNGWTPQGSDRFIVGTAASGALRRRSMDLTRKLAELRKP